MEHNEKLYQKGFNEGYVIAKHMPEMNIKPITGLQGNIRGEGFQDGQKQFAIEKNREALPGWLRDDRPQKESPDIDKSRDDIDRD